jgi:hypothetical protein
VGNTRSDQIHNENTKEQLNILSIIEKIIITGTGIIM